ncbi:hypothetical protein CDIK_2192 [Cucumispora dikerogammari]|nr:hypothetical protein CDIK_2192 [Cucumispora dikerogammari]
MIELEFNIACGRLLNVEQSDFNNYLVERRYIVLINSKKCRCNFAFEFEYPCQHFCAVLVYLRQVALLYVKNYFSVNNYNNSYSEAILPISSHNLQTDNLLPSDIRRP